MLYVMAADLGEHYPWLDLVNATLTMHRQHYNAFLSDGHEPRGEITLACSIDSRQPETFTLRWDRHAGPAGSPTLGGWVVDGGRCSKCYLDMKRYLLDADNLCRDCGGTVLREEPMR